MYIQAAFEAVCKQHTKSETWYVCLMERIPYYGGPEEGGWWGTDNLAIAWQEFPSEKFALEAKEKVEKLALELEHQSRTDYGDQCLRETEWLDARGLDDSFLREPDGPSEYYVLVTQEIPQNSYGARGYA